MEELSKKHDIISNWVCQSLSDIRTFEKWGYKLGSFRVSSIHSSSRLTGKLIQVYIWPDQKLLFRTATFRTSNILRPHGAQLYIYKFVPWRPEKSGWWWTYFIRSHFHKSRIEWHVGFQDPSLLLIRYASSLHGRWIFLLMVLSSLFISALHLTQWVFASLLTPESWPPSCPSTIHPILKWLQYSRPLGSAVSYTQSVSHVSARPFWHKINQNYLLLVLVLFRVKSMHVQLYFSPYIL